MLDKIQLEALDVESKPLGIGGPNDLLIVRDADTGGFKQTKVGDLQSAGGSVTSVNGEKGDVVLDAAEVGAAPAVHTHTTSQVVGLDTTLANKANLSGNKIVIPNYTNSPIIGLIKNQGSSNTNATTWITSLNDSDPTHKAIGVSQENGPVYWDGTRELKIYNQADKPTPAEISAHEVKPWILSPGMDADDAGNYTAFTYSNNAPHIGPLVSMGVGGYTMQFNSTYTGAQPLSFRTHNSDNATWNAWQTIYHTGNKPVLTFWEVGFGTRTDWTHYAASNLADGAVIGQLCWSNYGNGHTIFDASKSTTPSGTTVDNSNAQNPWSPSYPTLMGWNGTGTYGVRVDSSRWSDGSSSAQSLSGATITTTDQDLLFYGKRAVVGSATENLLYLNYGGDFTSGTQVGTSLTVGSYMRSGGQSSGRSTGDNFVGAGLETRSDAGSGINPSIGFHYEGSYAATLALTSPGTWRFKDQLGGLDTAVHAGSFHTRNVYTSDLNASGTISTNSISTGSVGTTGNINAGGYVRTTAVNYGGEFRGTNNVAGTGEAVYCPAGVYSTGHNWLYGPVETASNPINAGTGLITCGGLNSSGAITGTTVTGTSDKRKKTSITTLENSLEKVCQLRGVSYNWKDSGVADVGVIAQEVRKVVPEVVHEDEEGILSVDHGHLVGHLIEAIKALEKRVKELEGR